MQHNLAPQELPDLTIDTLGKATFDSPLKGSGRQFVDDSESVHIYSHSKLVAQCRETLGEVPAFELAGPREKLFFDPAKLNCGIVTCGGLCPGLNDVIRTITEGRAFSLLEGLAHELATALLAEFPVYRATLRVRKLHPPINGTIGSIEVELSRQQGDTSKLLNNSES